MIARAEPWQTAEVSGLTRALPVIKPEVVVAAIKKSKRPILIVGHEAASVDLEQGKPIDYIIQIAELTGAQIVATAHVIGEFTQRGFNRASWMPIMDISNRLRDPNWQGLDGQGRYDLVLLIGFQYYLEWVTLSGFKHFAPHLKTISLGRYHQPHANWSFPNVTPVDWERQLKSIVKQLKEK
jgi:acetyl-CoA decarbonylase/synthase complex subunit epsilon